MSLSPTTLICFQCRTPFREYGKRMLTSKVAIALGLFCFVIVIINNSKSLSLCMMSDPALSTSRVPESQHDSSIPILKALSDRSTFLKTVIELYNSYGSEVRSYRPVMRQWCNRTNSCKFTDFEVEMLYMLLREIKPQRVFEMAPNKGFSTHWILEALSRNDDTSKLYSYDIHNRSLKYMNNKFKDRWIFTLGDYQDLLKAGKLDMDGFDFIFIDALHTEEFSRGYCRNLLLPLRKIVVVAIHDIVADEFGGGRESSEVYKYIAFAKNVQNVFTVSQFGMPSILTPLENAVEMLHAIRASHKIVVPCQGDSCRQAVHDPLYFENNESPTLFFQLN